MGYFYGRPPITGGMRAPSKPESNGQHDDKATAVTDLPDETAKGRKSNKTSTSTPASKPISQSKPDE